MKNYAKEFKELVESVGYKLLEEYNGALKKVKLRCNKGHEYSVRPNNFKRGQRCPICTSKYSVQAEKEFKELVESVEYELLSEYKNNSTKIKIKCNEDHEYSVRPNSFKQDKRCPICAKCCPVQAEKEFKELLVKEEYELIDEYKGTHTKIKIKCNEDHEYNIRPSSFKRGQRCLICADRCSIIQAGKEFKELLESVGYELIGEYINSTIKVKIRCNKGHEYSVTPNKFKSGRRCPECFERRSQKEIDILNYVKSILDEEVISGDRTNVINPLTGNYLELDVWIPKLNKAIEFNGTYWHNSDYSKYKDRIKVKYCKDSGIELMVINELEYDNGIELCLNEIDNFLGIEKTLI